MLSEKNYLFALANLVGVFVSLLGFAHLAPAQETILHNFNGMRGASPGVSLVADSAGNLYGTTIAGGASGTACNGNGCGTVFELSPVAGKWEFKVLHNFGSGTDGQLPNASLILDSSGNLYGDTYQGGTSGFGTVFTLIPQPNGTWREKVLYNFTGGSDGGYPQAALMLDSSGNIYGTGSGGGLQSANCPFIKGCGVVFELIPTSQSRWREKVLYHFGGPPDGWFLLGGVVLDGAGNLFGTSAFGGEFNSGMVFELSPGASGWTESIVHSFNVDGTDGAIPAVGLLSDGIGSFYGTTLNGGTSVSGCGGFGCGTAFELRKGAGGNWTETILHSFTGAADGGEPGAQLVFDSAGNLYSTAIVGGNSSTGCGGLGCGTVFELKPSTNGSWQLTTLHNFGNGNDGTVPYGSVIFGINGDLYGTTNQGGSDSLGTAFELTPIITD
jgi:uncharacterized repeat protein (TIGR03803 family)